MFELSLCTSAPVLKQLNAGDVATKTGQQADWTSINVNGIEGWVHTTYITVEPTKIVNKASSASDELTTLLFAVNGLNVRSHGDL